MTSGLLWFDDKSKTLVDKVRKGAAYFEKKYHRKPELCLVNPSALEGQNLTEVDGIIVRPYRPVLPGHLWIGYEDKDDIIPSAEKAESPL